LVGCPVGVVEGLVGVGLSGEPDPGPGEAEGVGGVTLGGGVEPVVVGEDLFGKLDHVQKYFSMTCKDL
jgi:hypothetical protein